MVFECSAYVHTAHTEMHTCVTRALLSSMCDKSSFLPKNRALQISHDAFLTEITGFQKV